VAPRPANEAQFFETYQTYSATRSVQGTPRRPMVIALPAFPAQLAG